MDLLSLASMPFQRIPRYILLLKETLKYTDATNRDYELLHVAIKKLDLLTKAASERMRLEENSKTVQRISAMLDPPVENLARSYRKLVRDGAMEACFISNSIKTKEIRPSLKACEIFLFNDCMLLARRPKKSFLFDTEQKLQPIVVLDLHGAVLFDSSHSKNEFQIRVQIGTAVFQTKNWPEKEAWQSDIIETIELLTSGNGNDTRSLGRTKSYRILEPESALEPTESQREKLTRSKSQAINPGTDQAQQKKFRSWLNTATLRSKNTQRSLTRQLTLPQISLFTPQKFTAPAVQGSRNQLCIGRVVSCNSFFSKKKPNQTDPQLPKRAHSASAIHSTHLKPILLFPNKTTTM